MLGTTYTRVNLIMEIKGYPRGRICKLHFWLDGFVPKSDIQKYIDEKIEFENSFIDENDISRCYVDRIHYTNDKSPKEYFGLVIVDSNLSVVSSAPKVDNNQNNNTKPKEKPLDIKKIESKDLITLRGKIEIELFKREYSLTEEEYEFYYVNRDIIEISDIKESFKLHKGDAFKMKKINIRKKLTKNPLSN